MGWKWFILLIFTSLSFSLSLDTGVNWWGTPQGDKTKKVDKTNPSKVVQRGGESYDNMTAEEIFKESIKEFEDRLKRDKPLVEYLYFKDPNNPTYRKAYLMWIEWKQRKTLEITRPVIAYARYQNLEAGGDKYRIVDWFKRHRYIFFYFYRPDCPYCKANERQSRILEQLGLKVVRFNAYTDAEMFERWNIRITPTIVAVSKYDKKAVRWEGTFNAYSLLRYFYARLKNISSSGVGTEGLR